MLGRSLKTLHGIRGTQALFKRMENILGFGGRNVNSIGLPLEVNRRRTAGGNRPAACAPQNEDEKTIPPHKSSSVGMLCFTRT